MKLNFIPYQKIIDNLFFFVLINSQLKNKSLSLDYYPIVSPFLYVDTIFFVFS